MKVKIKLLGRYKDITGKKELPLTINYGDTIWHVLDAFIQLYPELEKDKKFIIVSKNNIYSTRETKISDGDEITLTPPVVSGG